jgi:carbonic anhydrase/acetyltransferase-like protein (isoleucine patch superfamily)
MSLLTLDGIAPELPEEGDAWVAPGAQLIGRVILRNASSVWFNTVLRGDNEPIVVGEGSNVQDGTVCHTDMGYPLMIGRNCTIGHMAILHGCTLGDTCLVGMGACVLNGAVLGNNVLVGAGALVTEGKSFPEGTLVMGRPAKVARDLTEQENAGLVASALRYQQNARRYLEGLAPAPRQAAAPAI